MAASCVQFSSWPALLISSTLFFAIVVFGEQQAVCYFYDGSVAPNHSPCNIEDANGQGSSCCNEMDTCLTNGYCLQTSGNFDNRLGTPSCTDRSWNAPSCPMDCKHGTYHLSSDRDRLLTAAQPLWMVRSPCTWPPMTMAESFAVEAPSTRILGDVLTSLTHRSLSTQARSISIERMARRCFRTLHLFSGA